MNASPARLPTAAWVCLVVLLLTVIQLAVGAVSGLPQFAGKGFGYRLIAYPLLMLIVPTIWWVRKNTSTVQTTPWVAFALIGAPFLIDVSGNTAGLYDSVDVWDNVNHFFNWMLLSGGIGLLIARIDIRPRWMLVLAITGLGCLLALGWEIGEWWTFIRRGTELEGAYEDTLSDELLGTAGALVAGLAVSRYTRPVYITRARAQSARQRRGRSS